MSGTGGDRGQGGGAANAAPGAGAALPAYDTAELRSRMVLFFSLAELRDLADGLGVTGLVSWERGVQDAARDLVRQAEQYCGLELLLVRLRAAKPLVEWPEMPVAAVEPAPVAFAAVPGLGGPGQLSGAAPAVPAGEVAGSDAPAVAPPGDAPAATAPGAPPGPDAAPAPAGAPQGPPFAVASRGPTSNLIGGPGTEAPRASRGVDPRILVAVAGLTVIAAAVAFLAGRSSGAGEPRPEAAVTPAASAPARRAEGPATSVADAFTRSLVNVARVCEVSGSNDPSGVLGKASHQCGPASLPPHAVAGQYQPPDPAPLPDHTARSSDLLPQRPAPPAAGTRCVARCSADHADCKSRCGAEPTQSSDYGPYQQCLGRCLSASSQCRLACP